MDSYESSPEPFDDHRTLNPIDGIGLGKSQRSINRNAGWELNNNGGHNAALPVPGGFGYARSSRNRIDDYTDSIGHVPIVESRQYFNQPSNGRLLCENRLSDGDGRGSDRVMFERDGRFVQAGNESRERIDDGGYFSLGLEQQLRQRSARSAATNASLQQDIIENFDFSQKYRRSFPPNYENRKRRFFDDQYLSNNGRINNSFEGNESQQTPFTPKKQARFSFVSAISNARFNPSNDRYDNEVIPTVSPLEKETKFLVFEMRQESSFLDSLDPPIIKNLIHSKRLLNGEIIKLEDSFNSEWLEFDNNKRIKICRYLIIPTYRYPKINFVGRIMGVRGVTFQKICKKYKCFMSIQGANSSKNRAQEIELFNSGDPQYAHFAAPLHLRIDVYAVPHIAHMRMAAILNLLHKVFIPGNDFDLEAFLDDTELEQNNESPPKDNAINKRNEEEAAFLESEFVRIKNYEKQQVPKIKDQNNTIDINNKNVDKSIPADNIPSQSSDIVIDKTGNGMYRGVEWGERSKNLREFFIKNL